MLSFVGRGSTSSDTRITDVFSRLPADLDKKLANVWAAIKPFRTALR
jgi:hypothetical protein